MIGPDHWAYKMRFIDENDVIMQEFVWHEREEPWTTYDIPADRQIIGIYMS